MKLSINNIYGNRLGFHLEMAQGCSTERGGDDARPFMIMSSSKHLSAADRSRGAVIIFKND